MPFESSLSMWVLLAFVTTSGALLAFARVTVRGDSGVWLLAVLLIMVPLALTAVLNTLSWTIERTPALLQAGFVPWVLAFVWLARRRPTAGGTVPDLAAKEVLILVAIPLIGCLLSLPAVWNGNAPPLLVPAAGQALALVVMWAIEKRQARVHVNRASEPPDSAERLEHRAVTRTVFLCYRRDDSADATGRLYDRLVARFGQTHVFKDVDSIAAGVDFRMALDTAIRACDVLLAVIGPHWLDAGQQGTRRIDDARDFVRHELDTALQRGIPIIPVLAGGAAMPSEQDLPPSLAPLAYRHAVMLRADPDFHHDVDRLIHAIEQAAATVRG